MIPALARKPGSDAHGAATFSIAEPSGLLGGRPQRLKRVSDVLVAAGLAVIALPVGLLIALAIAVDSPGPVFFRQTRIGKGRRRFRLWKFRSMVSNADEILEKYLAENPACALEWRLQHKLKNDPRITRVGRFLRRSSLDELPQLWNVLRGDMSMVGPRPMVDEEIPKYGSAFALYTAVTPGLTGVWQVSGRNDLSYRKRIELDTAYIRSWTPALDLKVLLKTVRVVLFGHGAY
jgi:Undecaprenyl-phosphate galactose phosphotransferase WbaP